MPATNHYKSRRKNFDYHALSDAILKELPFNAIINSFNLLLIFIFAEDNDLRKTKIHDCFSDQIKFNIDIIQVKIQLSQVIVSCHFTSCQ